MTVTPKLEVEANPGTTATTSLKLMNDERESKTFYIRSENFNAQDESGRPSFLPRQEGLATWIKAPLSITLGPGQAIELPIEIAVPYNADPGGHFAAIFFLTEPPNPGDDPGVVALSAKLGALVLLRVNGDFVEGANILEFGTVGKQKFFTQLPIQFYYRFQNTGEDHQRPIGDILISNLWGSEVKALDANPVEGSVLPKSVRKFTSVWMEKGGDYKQAPVVDLSKGADEKKSFWDAVNYQARNFNMGRYTATVKVAFGSKEHKTDNDQFIFYIIPWQLLVVAIPTLLIILYILRRLVKRYNRYIVARAQKNRTSNQ